MLRFGWWYFISVWLYFAWWMSLKILVIFVLIFCEMPLLRIMLRFLLFYFSFFLSREKQQQQTLLFEFVFLCVCVYGYACCAVCGGQRTAFCSGFFLLLLHGSGPWAVCQAWISSMCVFLSLHLFWKFFSFWEFCGINRVCSHTRLVFYSLWKWR